MYALSLAFFDVARLEAFGVGCFFAVVVTLLHVTGLDKIVGIFRKNAQDLSQRARHPLLAPWHFGVTVLLMLLLHIFDTCLWAFLLYWMKLIPDIHDSFYFSANTYTSLGYGDVPLSRDWRELSPLMAISGLFTFACTTSQLFSVLGSYREVVADLKEKHAKKSAA